MDIKKLRTRNVCDLPPITPLVASVSYMVPGKALAFELLFLRGGSM